MVADEVWRTTGEVGELRGDDELRRLGEAWGDSGTHAVSIVAWGGAGKTSLVAKWAGELATRGL